MMNLIETFQQRSGDFWVALLEHMQLSFISILIAVLIAVPLGIWLIGHKRIAEPIIQLTAIFQTIPSLALLGLLIPLIGIGSLPAIIALVVYALLPILRNTYTGLAEIDPALNEAADAMGMSRFKKLRKVQLPIALPVIMAGIRTAMVLIIGTATVAALIGAGGLGSLILLGIDRGNNALIILGAVPAALLAIFFDGLLRYLQKTTFKKTIILLTATLVGFAGVVFLPPLFNEEEDIIVAGKLGTEPEILMNMYKYLIEDQSDLSVRVEPNFGKTTFVFNALESGEIDIYPEFTGTVLSTFLSETPEPGSAEEDVYERAAAGLEEQYDMQLLEPMAYNNTYALAVPSALSEESDLQTISDLIPIASDLNAGFTLEFNDREDGYPGIQELYGVTFGNVQTMEPQLRYEAIERGDIDVIDAYSTDSEIQQYDLTVLEDDENLFPPYQGAPLMRSELLETYPELDDILNVLGGKITDDQMRSMNYQVNVDGLSAEEVAREFLISEGLLSE